MFTLVYGDAMRISNGVDGTTTSSDAAVVAISAGATGEVLHNLCVIEWSLVARPFFISIDGGSTWCYCGPVNAERMYVFNGIEFHEDDTVMVKRVPGGSDCSVSISLW